MILFLSLFSLSYFRKTLLYGIYTICEGGSVLGDAEFLGLYSGVSYSGGVAASTFTASSMVTSVGNVSIGPGGGGQPGGGGRLGWGW